MKSKSLFRKYIWLSLLAFMLLMSACTKTEPLFQRLEADETGVTFSNDITPNDTLNIVNYTNMYNGGGVGIADFNNDGLQDIYFTGLMENNELYLNQGEFEFTNVTEEANVAADGRWSSGVAVVDINSDGLMDIYVCATTNDDSERRTSLFYINQGVTEDGVPVFRDMAAEYNVDFPGHTTMAAFFDYDNDGDLDLYLMVNQFNENNTMNRYAKQGQSAGSSDTRDRLFRNEGTDSLGHPWFTEVSKQAGITHEGFGLGVNITDINQDGWKDIYVANDFYTNDLLYMNNGDGTFTDKRDQVFKHTAYAAMGNDVADLNNDGHPEVVVMDMRPETSFRKKKMLEANNYSDFLRNKRNNYDDQFVRNVLQVYRGTHPETGEPFYSDIGIHAGIAETDWSWAPLMGDFNNDGWRDLMVTNGFPKAMNDNDFEEYYKLYPKYISLPEVLERIPSTKISNYAYRNNGNSPGNGQTIKFDDVTKKWGMDIPSYSYGAAQADLNNDGTLDFVVNNIDQPAFIFRNRLAEIDSTNNNYLRIRLKGAGDNTMGLGAFVEIEYENGKKQFHEHTTYRGYESSVEPVVHFGLEDRSVVDKLTVTWPDSSVQVVRNVQPNQVLTLHQKNAAEVESSEPDLSTPEQPMFREITDDAGIDYKHQEWDYNDFNVQPLLPHKLSQYGPGLSVGDVNDDGLDDIYLSGAFEYEGTFWIQQRDGTFAEDSLLVGDDSENREEEMGSLFFDADGDGDQDLYIVSGSYEHPRGDEAYQDRLFINQNGEFGLAEYALPQFLSSGSAVRAADFDRDGDLDLFVGGRVNPHRYPEQVDSYLLENNSKQGSVDFAIANDTKASMLNEIGLVSDALWTDFNDDGWIDLVLAGEWMPLTFLKNDKGTFVDVTGETGLAGQKGWWNSLCGSDFDNDGDTDYIAGNWGTNTYFQASKDQPVRVYVNDFDQNGVFDMIPAIYDKHPSGYQTEVPFHGRENMIEQIPSIEEEFESFHAYASATMNNILSRYETSGMRRYQATNMQSSYIENLGNGRFAITPLPEEAQWTPVYGCVTEDINSDGNPDVILTGNDHGNELSAGRSDALNGLVLIGRGNGTFETKGFEESGFFVPGDGKALVKLRGANDSYLVAASQNRGPLKLFRKTEQEQQERKYLDPQPMDASAILTYNDRRSRKVEFHYGSSFLSSSSRFVFIGDYVNSVEITTYQGETRTVSF